ncbi:MAG: hypothetical protein QXZ44_06085 [Ferroplasma sp.]
MPINKRWSKFNKTSVSTEKDEYGIYEIANKNETLYIGSGKIRSSLMEHFNDGNFPIVGASMYRILYTKGQVLQERKQREELKKYFEQFETYPKYNRD